VVGEIVAVSAEVRQVSADLPPADTLSAVLEFENGVIGSYTISYAAAVPFPTYMTLSGDEGALRTKVGMIELYDESGVRTERFDGVKNVQEELAAFAAAVRENKPQRNSPLEGLRDLAVIEAMLKSAAEGVRIQVETFTDLETA